jgi:hypothetical protein
VVEAAGALVGVSAGGLGAERVLSAGGVGQGPSYDTPLSSTQTPMVPQRPWATVKASVSGC